MILSTLRRMSNARHFQLIPFGKARVAPGAVRIGHQSGQLPLEHGGEVVRFLTAKAQIVKAHA